MIEDLVPLVVVPSVVLGLPWIIFHYITRWKTAATLTKQDEDLLDDLNELARRLDDRVVTIERIMDAENPAWRATALSDAPEASRIAREPRIQETRR